MTILQQIPQLALALGTFLFVALAAAYLGQFFAQYGLPTITGYLLAGMVAGPFILNLMSSEDTMTLRFIDELSLAVIAFIAGSELYLKELRARLRSILLNTLGVVLIVPALMGVALFVATQFIPFTADMSLPMRIAVSILGGTILLALSPASTIAVIQEVRARGDFTKTILSITVVMDVIIIVLFAVAVAFAGVLVGGQSLDIMFVLALVIDLGLALIAGLAVGKLLEVLLSAEMPTWLKSGLVLIVGLVIFVAAFEATHYSKELGFSIHLEPLLISMIGGFYVTNYTRYRNQFDAILHDISPMVYVAFFTLAGVALQLDILLATGAIAVMLLLARIVAIFAGSYLGATLARETPVFRRYAWMGLITQAGIALGLAREVAVEFPTLGDAFATLIISVMVLNQLFGPLFLKYALRQVGDAHLPESAEDTDIPRAAVFGVEAQSVALARQLQMENWHVTLLDTNRSYVDQFQTEDLTIRHVPDLSEASIRSVLPKGITALVTMLEKDEDNLQAATVAYERCAVKRIIVRLNELGNAPQFTALGALVMNPTAAMVNLLDNAVRSPQSAALVMHADPQQEVEQLTIINRDLDGLLVRDLRLPNDVLILGIQRNGHTIVPNGYTKMRYHDDVTLIGSHESLAQVGHLLAY